MSYGASLAIWDQIVLPSTYHKWTHPALTPATQASVVVRWRLVIEAIMSYLWHWHGWDCVLVL